MSGHRGGAVLLAAGYSRRFGSDKRRHVLDDGVPLLLASVRRYASAFPELVVVLRPDDQALADAVRAERPGAVRVAICADAHRGMAHSLACGVRATSGWHYLFVALGDMPWVAETTLSRLRAALLDAGRGAIVQPCHEGVPGHPVGFGADWFEQLETLEGDEGARRLLAGAGPRLQRLEVNDAGVLRDLDTPPG